MKNDIEELIRLFSKLKEEAIINGIEDEDKDFFKNISTLIGTYELIKDDITNSVLDELSISLKEVIQEMIIELKQELGEDINKKETIQKSISDIDNLLKDSELSSKEVDSLLDERIKKQQNFN